MEWAGGASDGATCSAPGRRCGCAQVRPTCPEPPTHPAAHRAPACGRHAGRGAGARQAGSTAQHAQHAQHSTVPADAPAAERVEAEARVQRRQRGARCLRRRRHASRAALGGGASRRCPCACRALPLFLLQLLKQLLHTLLPGSNARSRSRRRGVAVIGRVGAVACGAVVPLQGICSVSSRVLSLEIGHLLVARRRCCCCRRFRCPQLGGGLVQGCLQLCQLPGGRGRR